MTIDDVLAKLEPLAQPSTTANDIERAERAAIAAGRARDRRLIGAVAVSLLIGGLGLAIGVRGGLAVKSLCDDQVAARLELARIKEDRVPLVTGPNARERRESLLAESTALRRTADRAQCAERYSLP